MPGEKPNWAVLLSDNNTSENLAYNKEGLKIEKKQQQEGRPLTECSGSFYLHCTCPTAVCLFAGDIRAGPSPCWGRVSRLYEKTTHSRKLSNQSERGFFVCLVEVYVLPLPTLWVTIDHPPISTAQKAHANIVWKGSFTGNPPYIECWVPVQCQPS